MWVLDRKIENILNIQQQGLSTFYRYFPFQRTAEKKGLDVRFLFGIPFDRLSSTNDKEPGRNSQNFLRKFVRFFVTLGLKILRLFKL